MLACLKTHTWPFSANRIGYILGVFTKTQRLHENAYLVFSPKRSVLTKTQRLHENAYLALFSKSHTWCFHQNAETLRKRILGPFQQNAYLIVVFTKTQRSHQNAEISRFHVFMRPLRCIFPVSSRKFNIGHRPPLANIESSPVWDNS